jgi:hypothetical protein
MKFNRFLRDGLPLHFLVFQFLFYYESQAALECRTFLQSASVTEVTTKIQTPVSQSTRQKTLIERALPQRQPRLGVQETLQFEVQRLRSSDPRLARQVEAAIEMKRRKKSLELDRGHLTMPMNYFLEGPFQKIVGRAGLSRPLITLAQLDGSSLIIRHAADDFHMQIKWVEGLKEPKEVYSQTVGNEVAQVLELPRSWTTQDHLRSLNPKFIHQLVVGSALNRYLPAWHPLIKISRALHDEQLVFDRPTQVEAKEVRKLIAENSNLKAKIKSLLFVASTAAGKTRVLTDAIIQNLHRELPQKLIVLATKTPDLATELALNVGHQIQAEEGSQAFRLVQWGGQLSEDLSLTQLLNFVRESDTPVVLVTSYPTLAARAPTPTEKALIADQTRALFVDEAHNATGETVSSIFEITRTRSQIEVMGVTASPVTRTQRTSELYDAVYWAGLEKPARWAALQKTSKALDQTRSSLEWIRMAEQFKVARERGEINGTEPLFFKPEQHGFNFTSIFKRGQGTSSSVHPERLQQIWPIVFEKIKDKGPGVIHTYPRDAEMVAQTLSQLSGRHFVSLQKLNVEERILVYEAFRKKASYRGRPVDGIVGTIREGLDFPEAGWYLNLKKFVRFPENIQGPGRVVRLAHNKTSPVILFFGEQVDKLAYEQVREFILSRIGKLPKSLPEGRLYSGMRRVHQREDMALTIARLNTAMEAFLRAHPDLTKALGAREKSNDQLNPEAIGHLQRLIFDLRASGSNRELDSALNQYVAELSTYPFFSGELKASWSFAEKVISFSKLTVDQLRKRQLSEEEVHFYQNPQIQSLAQEYRSFYANLGPVPRALLETFPLNLLNVSEVAGAVNRFIEIRAESPVTSLFASRQLKFILQQALGVSPSGLWRSLSPQSREILASHFSPIDRKSFEATLNEFVATHRVLPEVDIEEAISSRRTVETALENRLAQELGERLKRGEVDMAELSQEARALISKSGILDGFVLSLKETLEKLKKDPSVPTGYLGKLLQEGVFTYENLALSQDLAFLRVLGALGDHGQQEAIQLRDHVRGVLREIGEAPR